MSIADTQPRLQPDLSCTCALPTLKPNPMKTLVLSVLSALVLSTVTAQDSTTGPTLEELAHMTPQAILATLGQPTNVYQTASGYTWSYGCPANETNDVCIMLEFQGGVVTLVVQMDHAMPKP